MRSIKSRFTKEYKNGVSSYVAFYRAIKGQDFTSSAVSQNFNKLVEKGDYSRSDKNTIIAQLCSVSKCLRTPSQR